MKIAAVTMLRGDDNFLRKWIEYYGRELGKENLYIYFDGKDQVIGPWCEGTHTQLCDKLPGAVVEMEKHRLDFLSDEAAKLFKAGYDAVIGVDADEFLVVDPDLGMGLREFIEANAGQRCSISGLGIDVGQHLQDESEIRWEERLLEQRHYAVLGTKYTKPSVMLKPLRWGRGFHRIKGHNFHIAKGLYLFHFGYFDLKMLEGRYTDKSRVTNVRHLKKRSKTINQVSTLKTHEWVAGTKLGRLLQTIVRRPFTINKPAMLGLKIVVRIPERFSTII